jgi:hypothetical protein
MITVASFAAEVPPEEPVFTLSDAMAFFNLGREFEQDCQKIIATNNIAAVLELGTKLNKDIATLSEPALRRREGQERAVLNAHRRTDLAALAAKIADPTLAEVFINAASATAHDPKKD